MVLESKSRKNDHNAISKSPRSRKIAETWRLPISYWIYFQREDCTQIYIRENCQNYDLAACTVGEIIVSRHCQNRLSFTKIVLSPHIYVKSGLLVKEVAVHTRSFQVLYHL